jgi:hypothetical protein
MSGPLLLHGLRYGEIPPAPGAIHFIWVIHFKQMTQIVIANTKNKKAAIGGAQAPPMAEGMVWLLSMATTPFGHMGGRITSLGQKGWLTQISYWVWPKGVICPLSNRPSRRVNPPP